MAAVVVTTAAVIIIIVAVVVAAAVAVVVAVAAFANFVARRRKLSLLKWAVLVSVLIYSDSFWSVAKKSSC